MVILLSGWSTLKGLNKTAAKSLSMYDFYVFMLKNVHLAYVTFSANQA